MPETQAGPRETWWLRTRDLTPPESVTRGGPVTGVSGPLAHVAVAAVASLLCALAAVVAIGHLSLVGFTFFCLLAVVGGWVARVRLPQALAPAVAVGRGGVWLAGTPRRKGQAVAWDDVSELVFYPVVERDLLRVKVRRYRALGVRLRNPAPLAEADRAAIDTLSVGGPELRQQLVHAATLWQGMPSRQVGRAGAH